MPSSSYLRHFQINFCFFSFLANSLLIEGFTKDQYVGCFYDSSSQLLQWEDTFNMSSMTIELCIDRCRTGGRKTYAKLQNGSVCQCGDDYGIQALDSACNLICSGNQSEYCGGDTNGLLATYALYSVCPIGNYSTQCDRVCHCKRQIPCDRMTGKCPNDCAGKYTGSTCNTTTTSAKYIGCFSDNQSDRALPNRVHFAEYSTMTIEVCIGWCSDVFSTFAGAQFGSECYCGESYDKFGQLNESACSSSCSGNITEKCGAVYVNSVYSVCPVGNYGNGCSRRCNCADNGRCIYQNGSCISSSCKPGWTGTNCNLRDCSTVNGDCFANETCLVVDLKFTSFSVCRCSDAFQKDKLWQNCTDVDECATTTLSVCGEGAIYCTNTVGGYRCHCLNGQTTYKEPCPSDLANDHYVGCFYDNSYCSQPLQWEDDLNVSSMTIELCIDRCRKGGGKTYARLQNGSVCQCGDDYGVQTFDRACNSICYGSQSEFCGGATHALLTPYVLYTVCPTGYYNPQCDRVCHCKRQIPCGRMTGKCPNGCDGNYTGSTCNTTTTSAKYIGCFQDDSSKSLAERALPNRVHFGDNYPDDWSKVTINVCIGWCSDVFSTFAGTQYGAECYCGENYNKFGQLNESACSINCAANKTEKCGASNVNSVYSVCPPGNYGDGCSRTCNCANDGRCVYLNGSCISSSCKPGWTGTSCNFRDCAVVNGDCSTYETCLSIDLKFTNISMCRCSDGFQRDRLWQNCADIDECVTTPLVCGEGGNCTNTIGGYRCHCKNGQTADNHACALAASNTNGEKTATIIGAVVGSVCGVLVILAIIIAVVCYRRKRCKTPPTEVSSNQPNVQGTEPELQYSSLSRVQSSNQPNTDYDRLDVNAYEAVDIQAES